MTGSTTPGPALGGFCPSEATVRVRGPYVLTRSSDGTVVIMPAPRPGETRQLVVQHERPCLGILGEPLPIVGLSARVVVALLVLGLALGVAVGIAAR